MAKIIFIPPEQPPGTSGAGTVTQLNAGLGITLTPNPITGAGSVALTVPVTIILGGTNSISALSGSSIMVSNGTAIVQGAKGTTSTVLHGNAAGAPSYTSILTADIADAQVTYAKMQLVSAPALLGSDTGGVVEEITLGTGLAFSGTRLIATGGTVPVYPSTQIPFGDGSTPGGIVTSDFEFSDLTNTLLINSTGGNITLLAPDDNSGVILSAGTTTTADLRLVQYDFAGGSWQDFVPTTYMQIINNSGSPNNCYFLSGSFGADAIFDRLAFSATSFQVTNQIGNDMTVPTHLFEVDGNAAGFPIFAVDDGVGTGTVSIFVNNFNINDVAYNWTGIQAPGVLTNDVSGNLIWDQATGWGPVSGTLTRGAFNTGSVLTLLQVQQVLGAVIEDLINLGIFAS